MSTGMKVIDPKFVKDGIKLKKTKHCTIPPNLEKMKSEKASRIIRRSYPLCMGKENRKRHHNEKYAKKCKNLMGGLETYNQEKSREIKYGSRRQECQLLVKYGLN